MHSLNNEPGAPMPAGPAAELPLASRRDIFKVGLGFTLAISGAALVPGLAGCSNADKVAVKGFDFLQAGDLAMFSALIPTVVSDMAALPDAQRRERVDAVLHNIDSACAALVSHQRDELRKLFDLLGVGLMRKVLTGVGAWSEASKDDMEGFLSRWRGSRFETLNAGVTVLIKLTSVSYYVLPAAWPATGYPGPLANVFQAVNS